MTGLIFGQNFDCVSGEISAAFPFLCLQRRRMGLNFSFEGFFTLLNTLALAARVVVVLEQCPFIADFFALAAFQVHQKKIFSSDLSLVKNIHVYLDKDRTGLNRAQAHSYETYSLDRQCTQGLIQTLGSMVIFDENQAVSESNKYEFLNTIYVKIVNFLVI